jgi:hypothetical protein
MGSSSNSLLLIPRLQHTSQQPDSQSKVQIIQCVVANMNNACLSMNHSSRKRGTVYRSLNRNHRTESGFGDEVRFSTIRWPERVPGRSILVSDSAIADARFTFQISRWVCSIRMEKGRLMNGMNKLGNCRFTSLFTSICSYAPRSKDQLINWILFYAVIAIASFV